VVYEPDITQSKFPFPTRLAGAGMRSLVIAPLLVESQVFGILITARRTPDAFTSGDCEFLRQASEHTALAAHQAQLYSALQRAYDDLRTSQQQVMQQERLRALGQMASGIAHDINNAISPVALYTEALLERETSLSPRARSQLEIIQRAVDDIAQTVARMGEFYRLREPQLSLRPWISTSSSARSSRSRVRAGVTWRSSAAPPSKCAPSSRPICRRSPQWKVRFATRSSTWSSTRSTPCLMAARSPSAPGSRPAANHKSCCSRWRTRASA
jgi:putative methionine-R-sulfoxide reductase with GAF domain